MKVSPLDSPSIHLLTDLADEVSQLTEALCFEADLRARGPVLEKRKSAQSDFPSFPRLIIRSIAHTLAVSLIDYRLSSAIAIRRTSLFAPSITLFLARSHEEILTPSRCCRQSQGQSSQASRSKDHDDTCWYVSCVAR
jgi:hypothetical protein